MDKGELCNLALSYLGKPGYEEGTPDSKAVAALAQQCVALALDRTTWSFALRRKALLLDEHEGRAALPHDCLRLVKVHAPRFELIGRELYVDGADDAVLVDYVTNEYVSGVFLPDDQPTFCEGVALMLAGKVAPSLTSSFQLAAELESRAAQVLARARLKDARQYASNDQKPRTGGETERSLPVNILAE